MDYKPNSSALEQRVKELECKLSKLTRVNEALHKSEERHRLVLDAVNEGVWDWNAQSGEVYYNHQYCAMLGYNSDELPRQYDTCENLVHPADKEYCKDAIREHLKGENDSFELEFRMKTKFDGWKWILGKGQIVQRDSNQIPLRVIGTHLDISRRKKVEHELQLTQLVIDRASFGCIWVSNNNRIVYVNDQACQALGYNQEELLNMSAREIDPKSFGEGWLDFWKRLLQNRIQIFETHHQRKDGTLFPVDITANYVAFNEKEYCCIYVNDQTERKRVEASLQEGEERLRQAVRASRIGIFDHDHLTNTIYWSPHQREIHGWGPVEPVSLADFLNLVHPDDIGWVDAAVQRAHEPTS